MTVATIDFTSYDQSVSRALDAVGARSVLAAQTAVMIKPNLINDSPHPVTTPPACCKAVVAYVRACSSADIVIAEGCGEPAMETHDVFRALGYDKLAQSIDVALVDLNTAPLKKVVRNGCTVFPEMYLPEIAFSHFILSVPVLKPHSFAEITGTLKNMMGFAPPRYYSGSGGSWKKSVFHTFMQQSIRDLNCHRTPDLTMLDASIGLAEYHLGGPPCNPPVGKIVAGFDPVAVDRKAAEMLGLDWKTIPHLADPPESCPSTK